MAGAELDDKDVQARFEASKARRGSLVVGAHFGHTHTEPLSNTEGGLGSGGLDGPTLFSGEGEGGVMLHGRDFGEGAGTEEKSEIPPARYGHQGVDEGGVRDDHSGSRSSASSSSSSSSFSSESSLDPDGWGGGTSRGSTWATLSFTLEL